MKINILYTHYYERDGKKLSVGGIQTYISELTKIFTKHGYCVWIYQSSDIDFIKEDKNIRIIGCKCTLEEAKTNLLIQCKKNLNEDDIVIFGTDYLVNHVSVPSIAIQHGVSWDVPNKNANFFLDYFKKAYKAWYRIKQVNMADVVVCVDYNFVNWIRAISPYCLSKMVVIPNFTHISENINHRNEEQINVIFARRFFEYRGTRIFAEAIERVLNERTNIFVTVAGEGDDEFYLREKLEKYDNVTFIKYHSQDSMKIHSDKHIAVVPTVGSEGTSLSLLEAMAAGCAVICTDVGGMTNIVINDYNGKMISAGDVEQLYDAIIELVDNREKRNKLAETSYCTVKEAFSIEKWEDSWMKVIKSLM